MPFNDHPIFDYIFNLTVPGVKLELTRVQEFFRVIGEPWQKYRVVHIAGTNGKGSTAAMVASLLQEAGYRTGLNTSPHLVIPNERIRVNGSMIPDEFIVKQVQEWKPLIDTYQLTFFECLTALAMTYFEDQQVDFAVLETGLGGRLDATNVVDPDISVITAIDLDHRRILGDTLEAIAGEKAGIIKHQRPVLLGRNQESVAEVIRDRAHGLDAPFHYGPDVCTVRSRELDGLAQLLDIQLDERAEQLQLKMLGRHQVENLITALSTLEILGIRPDREVLQAGIDGVHWPARMEILQEQPLVLYDVAHNPSGVATLLDTLRELGFEDAVLLGGLNEKKDRKSMLELLAAWEGASAYFAFEGHSGCSYEAILDSGIPAEAAYRDLGSGMDWAMKAVGSSRSQCLCIYGSHYFASPLYDLFQIKPR